MVLEGYHRCPDSHDLGECHHLDDLGRHISLTVLTLTPKNYPWKPSGTTLRFSGSIEHVNAEKILSFRSFLMVLLPMYRSREQALG